MKTNDFKKLVAKTITELVQTSNEVQKELSGLRMKLVTNKLKNVKEYKNRRLDLAKIKTLISLKQKQS